MDEEFLEEVNIIHERKRGPIRSCLTNQKFLKGKQKGGALTYFPLLGPDNWRAFIRFFCFEEFGKGKINTIQLDQQVNFSVILQLHFNELLSSETPQLHLAWSGRLNLA